MSSKTIPVQTIVTCDVCNDEMTRVNSRHNAWLKIKRDALDWQGSPCGDGSISMDLCDSCLTCIIEAVNRATDEIRATDRKADAGKEER